jgi:hypothetical protein
MKKLWLNKLVRAKHKGAYLPFILIMSAIFIVLAYTIISIANANLKLARKHVNLISSMEISEAGINYYLWHLSHNNKDYCDGGTCPGTAPYGPYTHEYKGPDGTVLGTYDLIITPPSQGDSIVQVKVTGKANGSSTSRTIIAEIGMPSFAKYSFLTNTECWFGDNETTTGPVHSNVGVHFDGTANGLVTASSLAYVPSSSFGGDGHSHPGVWGNGGPVGFWQFPVPTINFNQVSVDLAKLQTQADAGGILLGDSKKLGYYLQLKANNTIDVSKVTKETSSGITTTFLGNYPAPNNGILFAQDYLWIDGSWNNKITIATSANSVSKPSVTIVGNLTYVVKDGTNKIGLIGVGNIEVAPYAPDTLEIDGAFLSQKGHVWYESGGPVKTSISIYGSIATFDYWTWTWVNSHGSTTAGYRNTSQTYDPYFTLDPPPQFPTTGSYNVLTWREQ